MWKCPWTRDWTLDFTQGTCYRGKCFRSADHLTPSPAGRTRWVGRVVEVFHPACRAIRSPAALRDTASSGRQKGKSFIFAAEAEAAGTVTLFCGAECLCIDLAEREKRRDFSHVISRTPRDKQPSPSLVCSLLLKAPPAQVIKILLSQGEVPLLLQKHRVEKTAAVLGLFFV